MRRYLDIIREAQDPLDVALQNIADYVQHNADVNLGAAARVLKANGYAEPMKNASYFRALFHPVTEEDHQQYDTIAELYDHLKEGIRFEMRGEQGFTTTRAKAVDFVGGTLHITLHPHEFPDHSPEAPLSGIQSIIVIYEVSAPANSVLYSMRGLQAFIKELPSSPGRDALDHALNDMWEGYGSDDEVVIDCDQGCKVVGVTLYDTSED